MGRVNYCMPPGEGPGLGERVGVGDSLAGGAKGNVMSKEGPECVLCVMNRIVSLPSR